MNYALYQVDAFAERLFTGNPAAVVPMDRYPSDATLQAVAAENNLSETAFLVEEGGRRRIRWFTPRSEVDLCGHATLAAGWVVLERLAPGSAEARFESRSGELVVRRAGDRLELDFPEAPARPVDADARLADALGRDPVEVLANERDYLVRLEREEDVLALAPDFRALAGTDRDGICVTAPGGASGADFVSRFFAPRLGIDEDPVTGSAHCMLTPYWSAQLGRTELRAKQLSERGGALACSLRGERVRIAGAAQLYLEGSIRIEAAENP